MNSRAMIAAAVVIAGLLGADLALRYRESARARETEARLEALQNKLASLPAPPAEREAAPPRAPPRTEARADARPVAEARPAERVERSAPLPAPTQGLLPSGEPSLAEAREIWRGDLSRRLAGSVPEGDIDGVVSACIELREKVAPFKRGETSVMDANGYEAAREAFRNGLSRTVGDAEKLDKIVAVTLQF